MPAFPPTPEQAECVRLFTTGDSLKMSALAGTGKTSTLELLAAATPNRRGLLLAFNRAIVDEAARRFPKNVTCKTVHSLAYGWARGLGYTGRLNAAKISNDRLAATLKIDPLILTDKAGRRVLQPGWLASRVKATIENFCRTGDIEVTRKHVPFVDGLDLEEGVYAHQDAYRTHVLPAAKRLWADIADPAGRLPFNHSCQPPTTLVRRLRSVNPSADGRYVTSAWDDVPITEVQVGDKVVSFSARTRKGYVRRAGSTVTATGDRPYSGDMVTATLATGESSQYTTDHICVVCIDAPLSQGNFVVYVSRRNGQFRVGRTTWRTKSQQNALGIRRRAESQDADAVWILSVHQTDADAALAEALAAYKYRIPTWQFRSSNETMPLAAFWSAVGDNSAAASECLADHGRDVRFPFWQRGDGWNKTRRTVTMRACNLLDGMSMLAVDRITPTERGALPTHSGCGGWQPIAVSRAHYEGMVYNLEVDGDHTYIGDGVATHNCYLKLWQLSAPTLNYDFIMYDEAQDANGCALAVFLAQRGHAQLVLVGDKHQAINEWNGAVNAMAKVDTDHEATLTKSFRFGPAVATEANVALSWLDAESPIVGHDPIASQVTVFPNLPARGTGSLPCDAILCRTNAAAVGYTFDLLDLGWRPALVGGADEIVRFAEGCADLRAKGSTGHPELCVFPSYAALEEYAESDQGEELRTMFNLVKKYGAEVLSSMLAGLPTEARADVVVSTAHKAKGREWDRVLLAGDFPDPAKLEAQGRRLDPADVRLMYVAVTRAKLALDHSAVAFFHPKPDDDTAAAPQSAPAAVSAAEVAPAAPRMPWGTYSSPDTARVIAVLTDPSTKQATIDAALTYELAVLNRPEVLAVLDRLTAPTVAA